MIKKLDGAVLCLLVQDCVEIERETTNLEHLNKVMMLISTSFMLVKCDYGNDDVTGNQVDQFERGTMW